jgi:arabinose-5-phosphate isomerase
MNQSRPDRFFAGTRAGTGARRAAHRGRAVAALAIASMAFRRAVELILACHGRVIVSGMGKSGHIARKIAATLASTGTPAYFVHPPRRATATSA